MNKTPLGPHFCLTWCGGRRDVSSSGQSAQVPAENAEELQNLADHDDGDAQVERHGASQTAEEGLTL